MGTINAYHIFFLFACVWYLSGCGTINNAPKYQLSEGRFKFREEKGRYEKVYIHANEDTVIINKADQSATQIQTGKRYFFLNHAFDVDVLVAPFKYRPSASNFPRQLNTSFNGNAYIGFRTDRFKVRFVNTPLGQKMKVNHMAFSFGGFGGIGSTAINPWTTNNHTTDEYDGFVLSRGLAAIVAFNNVNAGFGVGFDYLTDRDRNIWIYQNKPWYGVVIGLSLN